MNAVIPSLSKFLSAGASCVFPCGLSLAVVPDHVYGLAIEIVDRAAMEAFVVRVDPWRELRREGQRPGRWAKLVGDVNVARLAVESYLKRFRSSSGVDVARIVESLRRMHWPVDRGVFGKVEKGACIYTRRVIPVPAAMAKKSRTTNTPILTRILAVFRAVVA